MKLSEIEAVSPEDFVVFEDETAYSYTIDRGCKENAIEVDDFPKLYTAEQMQEYAEVKRDCILIIDGGIGTKLHATDRFTGTEAVDVYGDKYKVVNHVKNGKMWVLDNEEDTKNESR